MDMRYEFELGHLKYFYFTVVEGGVGAAAIRLHVQQPVVSKMLRSLEESFGEPLFRKIGRRKVLTDFGQLVYRHCQTVFHQIENLETLRSSGRPRLSGPLNFGCVDGVMNESLVSSLHVLAKEFPEVHPNVYVSTATHLTDLIASRKLEFALLLHTPTLPRNLEIVRRVPLRFRLVVASRERKNKKVIEKFIGSREIDDTSTPRFPTLERLRKDFPDAKIAMSANHLGLHKRLVMTGFGSAVLPDWLVRDEIKNRQVHDLYPQEKFIFDLKIVGLKSQGLSASAEYLLRNV